MKNEKMAKSQSQNQLPESLSRQTFLTNSKIVLFAVTFLRSIFPAISVRKTKNTPLQNQGITPYENPLGLNSKKVFIEENCALETESITQYQPSTQDIKDIFNNKKVTFPNIPNVYSKNVQKLVSRGVDVNAAALAVSAFRGQKEIVKRIISEGVNVNAANKDGNTALINSAGNGHEDVVEMLLLNEDVNVNAVNKHGNTALLISAFAGHKQIVERLISKGADVNTVNEDGNTALINAAIKGHKEIVEMLLLQDVIDVNAANKDGNTALISAVKEGFREIVEMLLLKKGVNVNAANKAGNTAFSFCAFLGYKEIAAMLLFNDDLNVNAANSKGNTALIRAAFVGHEEIVEMLLLKKGVNVNAANNEGNTALISAAFSGHEKIVEMLLLKDDINVNSANNEGDTALAKADLAGHKKIAKMLRARSSDSSHFPFGSKFANAAVGVGLFGLAGRFIYQEVQKFLRLQEKGLSKKQEEALQKTKEELLQLLNDSVAPLKEISSKNQGTLLKRESSALNTKKTELGSKILRWEISKKGNKIILPLRFISTFACGKVIEIFQNSADLNQKFFLATSTLISVSLDKDFKGASYPIEKNGNKFQIKKGFVKRLELIKQRLAPLAKEEQSRLDEEQNRIEKKEEKEGIERKINQLKLKIKSLEEELIVQKEKKANLDGKRSNTEGIAKRIKDLNDKIKIDQTALEKESERLRKISDGEGIELLEEGKLAITENRKTEAEKILEVKKSNEEVANIKESRKAFERASSENSSKQLSQYFDDDSYVTPSNSPRSLINFGQLSKKESAKVFDDLSLLECLLLGKENERFVVEESIYQSEKELNSLFDFKLGCIKEEDFFQKNPDAENFTKNFNENFANHNLAKKEFHRLLDSAIDQILIRSGDEEQASKKVRSRIYDFLNYCAGDKKSVEESYKISEQEGREVGFTKGEGHASKGSKESLSKLSFLLDQMQESEGEKIKKLQSVTIKDLDQFLKECFWQNSQNKNSQAIERRISYFTTINDNFDFMRNLLSGLKEEREKTLDSAPRQISDDTMKEIEKAVVNFVRLNSLAMEKDGSGWKSIDLDDLNKNFSALNQEDGLEKLKEIIKFSENFEQEEDQEIKEASKSLGAMSFKDLKDKLKTIHGQIVLNKSNPASPVKPGNVR